ncbi:tyrosine-type recombinase/integrase [Pseudonocardia alni]|uniref:tyrosine-type recombinase/integrase n=1 Tax=Pseudonocardia alni TaxID=33907 RepID=UPI001AD68C48|nr:tyrosine-type recombinase/integrase [Pseudonocardia alni]MBO4241460.1 tyrosine-type recombinase/integrase [Pseudonocardia alni]
MGRVARRAPSVDPVRAVATAVGAHGHGRRGLRLGRGSRYGGDQLPERVRAEAGQNVAGVLPRLAQHEAEVKIRPPKYGSERTVYLPDDLVTLLSQHVAELADGGTDRGLFPGADGIRPLHQNLAGYHWRRARDAAGVPSLRFHDLGHFYASGLVAEGADVVAVQRALGHGSATVTLNTYAHLWPTAEDRTRNAAARLMASGLNPPAGISRANERKMAP